MPKIVQNKKTISSTNQYLKEFSGHNASTNLLLPIPSLYVDFASTPRDMSPNNSTVVHQGSVDSNVQVVGPNELPFNCAKFDDSEDKNAFINFGSSDNPLAYFDSSDKAFSVSCWIKRDSATADSNLEFIFSFSNGTANGEVQLYYDPSTEKFHFNIRDSSSVSISQLTP